jgi:two-component system, NarL family, nitrate/nitrite response regulator NarL
MARGGAPQRRAASARSPSRPGGVPPARPAPLHATTRDPPVQVRLYVADPYPICIDGVERGLSRHEDIVLVGSALAWGEAIRALADLGPNVALIDDSLAGSCTAALEALAALESAPRVVFLTHSVETASVYEAIAAGAAGYLTRTIGPDMLVRALRDAFHGQTALSPELQSQLAEDVRLRAISAEMAVSTRERRTLQLIADGVPTREIAAALEVSRATIKSDISTILVKLGVHDRAAAVAAGIRSGLIE